MNPLKSVREALWKIGWIWQKIQDIDQKAGRLQADVQSLNERLAHTNAEMQCTRELLTQTSTEVYRMHELMAQTRDGMTASMAAIRQDAGFLRDALGRIEERQTSGTGLPDLHAHEFKVSSQWGEDGIIQYILNHIEVPRKVFVEFGVESYIEANTRWLLTAHNWSGLIMDGSDKHMSAVKADAIYWRHNLKAVQAFVTRENINELLLANGISGEIGLLSIDVDGVDYWIWQAVTAVSPAIVVMEYNSLFGAERAVTVPYDPEFQRDLAHYSCSYYGASLAALVALGKTKGYSFVGSNSAGNNAFFVRNDLMQEPLRELSPAEGFVRRCFREARNENGELTFPAFEEESAMVSALPLVDIQG